jgi:hypothetical protein
MKKEDKEKLIKLILTQSSAIRVAYNTLRDLEKEKTKNPYAQIYQRLRKIFPELPIFTSAWQVLRVSLPILVEGASR